MVIMLVLLSDRPKSFYSKSIVTASILYVIYAFNLKVRLYAAGVTTAAPQTSKPTKGSECMNFLLIHLFQ